MELGKYYEASKKLSNLKDKKSFDYIIRKAKLEDHYGRTDNAIELMEEAATIVKEKRKSSYIWTLSNLADMYGHAGRIKESYQSYLKVLDMDSANLYCLKGIAWIAFSHDKNTTEAKRILNFILSLTNMPDLNLTLADIAEWEGNEKTKLEYIHKFTEVVTKPGYGAMYNKYLIYLYTEELKDYDKALALATHEIESRPTPETYNWLATIYFNSGETEKAFQIIKDNVYKRTYEPDAMMNAGLFMQLLVKKTNQRKF